MNTSTFKTPLAWLPVAMSLAALAMLAIHIAIYGIVRETDEGTPAHIFQLLMVLQLPLIAFFIARWIPREPQQALVVVALQVAAAIAAIAAVFFLT